MQKYRSMLGKRFVMVVFFVACFYNTGFTQQTDINALRKIESPSISSKQSQSNQPFSFITAGMSISPAMFSIFAKIGTSNGVGPYFGLKSNLNFFNNYDISGPSTINEYMKEEVDLIRFAVTGGLLIRITNPLAVYIGGGYGLKHVTWETLTDLRYRVTDISYSGLEFESGVVYRYKNTMISVGFCIQQKQREFDIGFGIPLN